MYIYIYIYIYTHTCICAQLALAAPDGLTCNTICCYTLQSTTI